MCRRNGCAPGGPWALAIVLMMTTVSAAAAGSPSAAGEFSWREIRTEEADSLSPLVPDVTLEEWFAPTPLTFVPPEPEEKPVVVPLPPALGMGLACLGLLAVLRLARRVYLQR